MMVRPYSMEELSINKAKKKKFNALLVYLIVLLVLGYLVPVIVFHQPFGTDVYTHIYMTSVMSETESLEGFYEHLLELNPGSEGKSDTFSYPFGMWLIGSMIHKITDLSFRQISYILPIINIIIVTLCFFVFSNLFLKNKIYSLFALIFFVSSPIMSTSLLGWSPSLFFLPLLLILFFCIFFEKMNIFKRLLLFSVFSFVLIISHTATTIFFMFSLLIYILLENIFIKNPTKRYLNYSIIFGFFTIFIFTIKLFSQLHFHYWLTLMIFNKLISNNSSQIIQGIINFYSYILEYNHFVYFILIPIIFIGVVELIIVIKRFLIERMHLSNIWNTVTKLRIKQASKSKVYAFLRKNSIFFVVFVAIAILLLGDIITNGLNFQSIKSKYSLLGTLFWLGFIQCFLVLFAFKKINKIPLILFISFLIVIGPTGIKSAESGSGTGTTRFISFLLILIPILSVIGLNNLFQIIKSKKIKLSILSSILSILLIITIVGNIYFTPKIAENYVEKVGLSYLKSAPSGSYAYGLLTRQRTWLYGGMPNIEDNYPYGEYPIRDINKIYSTHDKEALKRFSEHKLGYIIDSKREKKVSYYEAIAINDRSDINKLYNSKEFSIYGVN